MVATKDRFVEFEKIIGFNLIGYLLDFSLFVKNSYPLLVNFFSGRPNVILSSSIFDELSRLLRNASYINENIYLNRDQFYSAEHWVIATNLEDIRVRLFTMNKISKWLRSSITQTGWNSLPEFDHIMMKYETLESIHFENLNDFTEYNNNWHTTAIRNDLYETEYTPEGGVLLKLSLPIPSNIFLQSVVDNLSGVKLYGLDINRRMNFVDDDLDVLNYQETFIQAVNILAMLKKNDIPEFPFLGLDARFSVGYNEGSLSYPIIMRQLFSVFSSDDTISEFKVENMNLDNGALSIDFSVRSKHDFIYNSTFVV